MFVLKERLPVISLVSLTLPPDRGLACDCSAVVRSALTPAELDHLDDFRIRTQQLNPAREKSKGWWAGDDGNLNW